MPTPSARLIAICMVLLSLGFPATGARDLRLAAPWQHAFVHEKGPGPLAADVTVTASAQGFHKATTDADLAQLFKDNLTPDLLPFQRQGGWSIEEFKQFVMGFNDTVPTYTATHLGMIALITVQNGTRVTVHWLRGADAHWRFACIKAAIQQYANVVQLPDTAFLINLDDFPICNLGKCPMPVFANFKKWANGNIDTNEVLFPVFNHGFENLYVYPWESKLPKALMRAAQQGCMHANSSRAALALASQHHPQWLDAGLTGIVGSSDLKKRLSKAAAGFVPIEEHAKWRYLVSADGCVGAARLTKVLMTNSVVMKEDSQWIEYFYRSLQPWRHYVPFAPGRNAAQQLMSAVQQLESNDTAARGIADEAQHWAYRYLTQHSRMLYVRRLLLEYNSLFNGQMEGWVASGGPEALWHQLNQQDTSETAREQMVQPQKQTNVSMDPSVPVSQHAGHSSHMTHSIKAKRPQQLSADSNNTGIVLMSAAGVGAGKERTKLFTIWCCGMVFGFCLLHCINVVSALMCGVRRRRSSVGGPEP